MDHKIANIILLQFLEGHLRTYSGEMCGRDKQMLRGFIDDVERYFEGVSDASK